MFGFVSAFMYTRANKQLFKYMYILQIYTFVCYYSMKQWNNRYNNENIDEWQPSWNKATSVGRVLSSSAREKPLSWVETKRLSPPSALSISSAPTLSTPAGVWKIKAGSGNGERGKNDVKQGGAPFIRMLRVTNQTINLATGDLHQIKWNDQSESCVRLVVNHRRWIWRNVWLVTSGVHV